MKMMRPTTIISVSIVARMHFISLQTQLIAIFNAILIILFIRHTFDSVDATVNRNSDRENGTIYPVTPTKELNGDFSSSKYHVSGQSGQYAHSAVSFVIIRIQFILISFHSSFRWAEVVIGQTLLR